MISPSLGPRPGQAHTMITLVGKAPCSSSTESKETKRPSAEAWGMVASESILRRDPRWQKRRVLFSPHRHPCSPLSFLKHSFQTELWPSCPCPLLFSVGWSSSLLTEECAGKSLSWPIFSRNAVGLEQQEDH